MRTRCAWATSLSAVAILAGMAQLEWMRRSVLLDIVSLWPALAGAGGILWLYRWWSKRQRLPFRKGRGAVLPILLLGWVLLGLGLHLAGWEGLPSAADHLAGPLVTAEITTATLDVELDGEALLAAGADLLYEVLTHRSVGAVAPAEATELVIDQDIDIRLREIADAGWFGSAGWNVLLSMSPEWKLVVRAERLDADLTGVRLRSLHAVADGRIRLGAPTGDVPVRVAGNLVLEVPSGASVEVIGPARVGPGWEITATGRRHAGEGNSRYLIEVDPGSDVVVEIL